MITNAASDLFLVDNNCKIIRAQQTNLFTNERSVGVGIKNNYYIQEISYKEAMQMVIDNHYLHRKAPCSYSFGLFEKNNDLLIGCVTYGKPASNTLCDGICGKEEAENVYELTRLWIADVTPHNAESYLIGNTIKLIPAEILVSFAEPSRGHIGYVYQATNWIYTGLSSKHVQWYYEGMENNIHSRHWYDEWGSINEAKKALGDKLIRHERPRKHRYIFFNCNKRRKRELINKLKYPMLPYPKK